MFNNYQYFLALAEEKNLSRAAERLFVSHQRLSQYLKSLENEYGTELFTRRPFELTDAGNMLLESLREVERIDQDFHSCLSDFNAGRRGTLRIGTTEGRLRVMLPDLLPRFYKEYPRIELDMQAARTPELLERLRSNQLDFIIIGNYDIDRPDPRLRQKAVLQEHLYLVISDNLLKETFPDRYPDCIREFSHGADLREFQDVLFLLNHSGFSTRIMLKHHLMNIGAELRKYQELSAMDLQYRLASRDMAACFALTIYLEDIHNLNLSGSGLSRLHVFPILGMDETNQISITFLRGRKFPSYTRRAMKLVEEICAEYSCFDLSAVSRPEEA
ncbi:MAG: LysR family transcriptional regulator [Stomatobaculum sp.]|nr:LysR family transcriptional regulator [Stomatobaculum sp.]